MNFKKKNKIKQVKNKRQELADGAPDIFLLNLLNSEKCQKILRECREYRDRIYSPTKTLFTFIKQVLNPDKSCKKAVSGVVVEQLHSKKKKQNKISSNTGPYCKARKRLPEDTVKALVKESGAFPLKSIPMRWKVYGRELKAFDGSTVKMSDTKANQKKFPQHGNQKKGAGFPMARIVAVMSLTRGTVIDYAIGAHKGKGTGEISLLREIINCIKADDIVLGDRYYPNFFLMADLKKIGADGVFRGQSQRNYDFRMGQKLGKNDHIVNWEKPQKPEWMTQKQYEAYPDQISIREFKVSGHIYVTTFLDKKYHKAELAQIYKRRWEVELNLRSIKSIMNMDMLSCKTPEMVRKEIGIHLLAYNFIRIIIAKACYEYGVNPWEISFKGSVQLLNEFIPYFISSNQVSNHKMYIEMLKLIVQNKVGNRPDRVEPRLVKQRPKPFPALKRNRAIEKEKLLRKINKRILKYSVA